jgi:microcompartment protein CcmL/EutN
MQEALGMVETKGLVAMIEAADAMVKAANRHSRWLRKNRRGLCHCESCVAMLLP